VTQGFFYLLAGPNGAGKSTLYRAAVAQALVPAQAEFVNADVYEREHLQHISEPQARSEAARRWADTRRATLIAQGQDFVSETVFSHASKLQLIASAQAAGYAVVLLVVCVDEPQTLVQRVAQRVREGGHSVPPERVLARYPRTLANLQKAVRLADIAMLYDTSSSSTSSPSVPVPVNLQRVAVCRGAKTQVLVDVLPQWALQVLKT
jgi:predicted ABC-type ATPase